MIANIEAELPPLPPEITVHRVDDAPPAVSVFRGEGNDDERRNAVWLDKGRKVAAGAILAKQSGAKYIMSVDADDLISCDLPKVVMEEDGKPGWYVDKGWLLPVGSKIGLLLDDFHNWCGTYVIVRTDLLPLAESVDQMDPQIIRSWFGHHRDLIPALRERGHSLSPLLFPAAVYRIGHGDGNYQRCSLMTEAFSWEKLQEHPVGFVKRIGRLRPFLSQQQALFMGGASAGDRGSQIRRTQLAHRTS